MAFTGLPVNTAPATINIRDNLAGIQLRFDKLKPGIIKELGPFMDDVIAGLIGGVSSSMYTRAEV